MDWVPRLGELDLLIKLLHFWTRRNWRNQGKVFCSPVQGGEGWEGAVIVSHCPRKPYLEVRHFLYFLHLLKPLMSQGHIPAGDFTRRNSETEIICVAWALFLEWNRFCLSHFSNWSCMRKGWTSPFPWMANKIKACLCYAYILIAQPLRSWLLSEDGVKGKTSRLPQE